MSVHRLGPITITFGASADPLPSRDDHVAAWLKAQRDEYPADSITWNARNDILDAYRLHADTGTPLDEHACEGRVVGDCGCLEAGAR